MPDLTKILWLDIETRKVPAGPGFPLRLRWQPFMVGIAWAGGNRHLIENENENELIASLRYWIHSLGIEEIRYAATREFDEMILRGRFTNARRAHLPSPPQWWPNLNELPIRWHNIRKMPGFISGKEAPRGSWDCASKDVPDLWRRNGPGDRDRVRAHCVWDVYELQVGDPDFRRFSL